MTNAQSLTPRLVIDGAAHAIDWYVEVLDAQVTERYNEPDGRIVHAMLDLSGVHFAVVDADPDHGNDAPKQLGGSPVLLMLSVESDVDAVADRMVDAGADTIFPVADQFYGERGGRFRDPFGHVWMLSQRIEELSPDEVQRRIDDWSETNG